ncbi:MAG: MmgE/PrpD family protein [Bauldia sp.]
MDEITRRIAEYASDLKYSDLPKEVVAAAKIRLIDTLGVALGGKDCNAVLAGKRLTGGGAPDRYPGRVLGSRSRASAESATFVNTSMIRYLDFNDAVHGIHPSDMTGALLALAESVGADGKRLLSSLVVAYEVGVRMAKATQLREKGWDQGFAVGIGTAAGVGHLLGLSAEKISHAVSITCTANVPLRTSRAGALSNWKGSATAFAARNAVFASLLAAEGVTGPDKSFEGRHGLWDLITGPFKLQPWASEGGNWIILATKLKFWPVEGNTLTIVPTALQLREKMKADQIASIDIDTHWSAWHETASEPEKWDPQTRETADHSMPYIFARTFTDGVITVNSYEPALAVDPAIRPLMNKIKVHNPADVEAIYKGDGSYPFTYYLRTTVVGTDGKKTVIEVKNPRGTPQNPMNDDEVDAKFLGLAEPVLGKAAAEKAVRTARAIETADKVTPMLDAIVYE